MSENENNLFSEEFDLGSDLGGFTVMDGDNPFGNDDFDLGSETKNEKEEPKEEEAPKEEKQETITESIPENVEESGKEDTEENKDEPQTTVLPETEIPDEKESNNSKQKTDEEPGLFDSIISEAEDKQVKSTKGSLVDKMPVFTYAKATEEIADPSITFDKLRYDKSGDFPELDDGTSVSWKVTYAGVNVNVTDPKKATIASVKTKIEASKDFENNLKKMKTDKERLEVVCKVTPSVTAKKKGFAEASYKGMFKTVDDAVASQKAIGYVPSGDGLIYEVRKSRVGSFIAPSKNVSLLEKVKAGFIPALPKIPYEILAEVISFFRSFVTEDYCYEAMCYICFNTETNEYYVSVPEQSVTGTEVTAKAPDIDEDRDIMVMEVHSHNIMHAFFSETDNCDEKATGLYCVIGHITDYFPHILTRASVGGNFVNLPPSELFEMIDTDYPDDWQNLVSVKTKKKDGGQTV